MVLLRFRLYDAISAEIMFVYALRILFGVGPNISVAGTNYGSLHLKYWRKCFRNVKMFV